MTALLAAHIVVFAIASMAAFLNQTMISAPRYARPDAFHYSWWQVIVVAAFLAVPVVIGLGFMLFDWKIAGAFILAVPVTPAAMYFVFGAGHFAYFLTTITTVIAVPIYAAWIASQQL